MRLSPNEIAWCAQQAGFAGNDLVIAVAIALAESNGDTDALGSVTTPNATTGVVSGNFDHGLWQISNKFHGAKLKANPNWRNPLVNAGLARLVFLEAQKIKTNAGDGWKAWSTYTSASYAKKLPFAQLGVAAPFQPVVFDLQGVREIMAGVVKAQGDTLDLMMAETTHRIDAAMLRLEQAIADLQAQTANLTLRVVQE